MQSGDQIIKIGPRVLCFNHLNRYAGWTAWSEFRQGILEELERNGIIERVERLGLRYVNFFQLPILEHLDCQFSLAGTPLAAYSGTCRFEIPDSGVLKALQIANRINLQKDGQNIPGSLVDIDCILPVALDGAALVRQHLDLAGGLHDKAKSLFFSLLKPELLASLQPEY
jgi:uncharacterized protein (TIGR04255 family)